ncbi:hypothetical protein J437_LFUL017342, partial [Ladona fulva]
GQKTSDEKQSEKLQALQKLHDIPIRVEVHRSLNTCRGVISSYDLLYVSEEEITKEMASQGVNSCRRLSKKQDEKPPEKVYVGFEVCSMRPSIPSTLRCFQCNYNGHTAQSCKGKPICHKCAKVKHDGEPCSSPPLCCNCGGNHPAYGRDYPKLQEEKKIMEIKITQKVPHQLPSYIQ